jgi:hypothetical protein
MGEGRDGGDLSRLGRTGFSKNFLAKKEGKEVQESCGRPLAAVV